MVAQMAHTSMGNNFAFRCVPDTYQPKELP